eukprot:TRINITY_DN5652_c0_g1_i1.p1 TRINITY_DN5652_c0_g1~~TRINITY_DN5652_c0_g1_i1.p1  ORF type:complete len:260 (+),score=40.16 TRINITY_DN5652_c0_g1_i1:80-859(+)
MSSMSSTQRVAMIEALPEEMFHYHILTHFDSFDLLRFAQVSKLCNQLCGDSVWQRLFEAKFPLFVEKTEETLSEDSYQERYRRVLFGKVSILLQLYDDASFNAKDCVAHWDREHDYYHVKLSYIRTTSQYANTLLPHHIHVRPRPKMLEGLAPYGELYIPPLPYSEYFTVGEHIELQWGSGWYWWKGVVISIDGDRMMMAFTHFSTTSTHYTETAIYGKPNSFVNGVRKITEEQLQVWKQIYKSKGYPIEANEEFLKSL